MKRIIVFAVLALASNLIAAERKIIRNTDRFELIYSVTLPEIKRPARLWIPLARTDSHQRFEVLSIESPVPWHKTRDKFHQNEILVLNPSIDDSNKKITIHYQVIRREKIAHSEIGNPKRHLKPEKLVPNNERFKQIGRQVTA